MVLSSPEQTDIKNQENNIQPQTIRKKINEGIIETLRKSKSSRSKTTVDKKEIELSLEEIDKRITTLKQMMKEAARDLNFEQAIRLREEIKILTESRLLV